MNRSNRSILMLLRLALAVIGLAAVARADTPQTGTVSWRKSCTFEDQGSQGCDVTVTMIKTGTCTGTCAEFCITISVTCPAGIPSGDPGESCEQTVCEVCCDATDAVQLDCDGQSFSAKPKQGQGWDKVVKDCSELDVAAG